jgi:hypothetical protein
MGNRIADIGKMKSLVDGENRLRTVGLKKTAKLGTDRRSFMYEPKKDSKRSLLCLKKRVGDSRSNWNRISRRISLICNVY